MSFAAVCWASELGSRGIRFRVDGDGVHARFFLCTSTIRWSEIGDIVTAAQQTVVQYTVDTWRYSCVLGEDRQIAFPESMPGADELAATLSVATGMSWHDAHSAAEWESSPD